MSRMGQFVYECQEIAESNYNESRDVTVRYDDFETAMRIWKRKVKKSGILLDLKQKEYFETRREKQRKAKQKAIRRCERKRQKEAEAFLSKSRNR